MRRLFRIDARLADTGREVDHEDAEQLAVERVIPA